jgi:hypothetical protein
MPRAQFHGFGGRGLDTNISVSKPQPAHENRPRPEPGVSYRSVWSGLPLHHDADGAEKNGQHGQTPGAMRKG